jgi:hypothetical protein
MGKGRRFNKKGRTRLKKTGVERRRRIKVHQKRLIALGTKEADVRRMTSQELRVKLKRLARRPGRTKKAC